MIAWVALLTAWPALAGGVGTSIGVINTADSGTGSLRWAIQNANAQSGSDPVPINFAPGAVGGVVQPLTPLPTLTRDYTTIDGDLDDNGTPDAWIDGGLRPNGSGLVIAADYCNLIGLCVTRFPKYGVMLSAADYGSVRSCHLGVSPDGTDRQANTAADLVLWVSDFNQIGGTPARRRNVIAAGGAFGTGIYVANSHYNKVEGNYIGLRRDGLSTLPGWGGCGVYLKVTSGAVTPTDATSDRPSTPMTCLGNTIGGTRPAQRNLFGGLTFGAVLSAAEHNFVQGNYFGLAADGDTVLPFVSAGVSVQEASFDNVIGGTDPGARNVFSGGQTGVYLGLAGTVHNRILGNWFGLNAAGTEQRALMKGVWISNGAGEQTIGGPTTAHRNYFAPNAPGQTTGVSLATAGEGTVVQGNWFGVRPDGKNAATMMDYAVTVGNVRASITHNLIARAKTGIDVGGPSGDARVYHNVIRNCTRGVRITNLAQCLLGNLGNANPDDNGDNTFGTNAWHIDNRTGSLVHAEGNDFGTSVKSAIDAEIYDKKDDASCGRVDFVPLKGGVTPTGGTEGVALAVRGATAQPTARGVELVFALSTPASVTVEVLNLAGRPIAVLQEDTPTAAGVQRLVWTGLTRHGLPAPGGSYLLRITAPSATGAQARALAPVRLER